MAKKVTSARMWELLEQMRQEGILPLGVVNAWNLYYALSTSERSYYSRRFTQKDAENALYWAYQRGVSGQLLRDWVAEYARREGELCQAVVPVRCRWGIHNELVQLEIFNVRDLKSLEENMRMALRMAHPYAPAEFPCTKLRVRRGDVPDLRVTYQWRGEVLSGKIRPVDVWRAGGFAACFCGSRVKDKEITVRSIEVVGKTPRLLPTWQAVLLRLWEMFSYQLGMSVVVSAVKKTRFGFIERKHLLP